MPDYLARIPPAHLLSLAAVGLVALLAIGLIANIEGRHFRRLGLGAAWLKLRIATIPIMALSLAVIWGVIVSTRVSGMEGQAVAYLVLVTVGPLVYFALHALVGRLLGLSRGVSAWIAFSGLLIAGMLPAMGSIMMPILGAALHAVGNPPRPDTTPEAPSPYAQAAARRLALPDKAEVWAVHWRAPEGIQVTKVALETQGVRIEDVSRGDFSTLCLRKADVHLLWPAERPQPTLQVYWKNAAGSERRSTWKVAPPDSPAEPFAPAWSETAVTLPVAVPKGVLTLSWPRPGGGSPIVETLQQIEWGGSCAPGVIDLKEKPDFGRPTVLHMRVDHAGPAGPNFVSFRNPAAPAE